MKTKAFRIFTVLAILLVLVTMVACKNEVKEQPQAASADIPSEEEGSLAKNFDMEEDSATIQKVFTDLINGRIGKTSGFHLPYLLFVALIAGLFFWFLYNKMRHGKYMYAIGGNEVAAEVSGVNTTKTLMIIYTTAGIMYAIAGWLLAGKTGGASTSMGMGYELEAIAACTIGGVSTTGGIGTVSGVLVGVLVFELLKIVLQFLGVNPYYNYIVQGVVIVVAVALDVRKYLAKK